MMTITVGTKEYELKTNLGVAKKLEGCFKTSLINIFGKIEDAHITELIRILNIAGGKTENSEFENSLLENWGYTDLQMAVQELLAKLMFSGTPEQQEEKINKFPVSESQKNAIRGLLRLPQNESAQSSSSEQLTE